MNALKVVYFDIGGVLIEDPAPRMIEYFAKRLEWRIEDYARVSPVWMERFQRGTIDEASFWRGVAEDLGRPRGEPLEGLWGPAFVEAYIEQPPMHAFARAMKARGLATGVLSNTEIPAVAHFNSRGYDCFDHLVFSCECGFAKPEPAIYEHALSLAGASPGECMFIDDKPENVEAAARMGIHAHRFDGNWTALADRLAESGIKFRFPANAPGQRC